MIHRLLFSAFLYFLIISAGCASAPKEGIIPPSGLTTGGASLSQSVLPSKAPQAPVPIEEYFKILRVRGASFSYDDKLVAYLSDEGGRMDIWVQLVEGGKARQITHVDGMVHSFSFCPTSDFLLYEADDGGDEIPHIYLTDSNGKAPKDLMEEYPQGARTRFIRWADDGKTFLYLSNIRDEKYMDLYEYSIKTAKSMILWKSSEKLSFRLTSRNHKRFIINETISDADTNLYLLNQGSKKLKLLTPHEGEVIYEPVAFLKNGKTLYYISDEGREFTALYSMELKSGKSKPVLEEEWDITGGAFSETWKYFYSITNVDGTPKVALTDAKTGTEIKLASLAEEKFLVPEIFSRTDRYLAAYLEIDTAPPSLYIIDLQEDNVKELTRVLPESLKGHKMVAGESVRIPSFDTWEVPAFIYRPEGEGPFPALIDVHGGPTWQSFKDFRVRRQYFVSKGYVVIVPNVRGSTGYGKSYTKLDNLDLGGGPLKDILYCKKWLVENADADKDRVVIWGGSYGGYMALAAAAFAPSEFAAHVDYCGPSDLKSLVESFPPYWTSFATYIYKKFGDPGNPDHAQYQYERSPINFVDKIIHPLLVVQGENDPRVKKEQSDQIVARLKDRRIPVHYLIVPDEGHGITKRENLIRAYQVTDRFLDRYIFNDTSVKVLDE